MAKKQKKPLDITKGWPTNDRLLLHLMMGLLAQNAYRNPEKYPIANDYKAIVIDLIKARTQKIPIAQIKKKINDADNALDQWYLSIAEEVIACGRKVENIKDKRSREFLPAFLSSMMFVSNMCEPDEIKGFLANSSVTDDGKLCNTAIENVMAEMVKASGLDDEDDTESGTQADDGFPSFQGAVTREEYAQRIAITYQWPIMRRALMHLVMENVLWEIITDDLFDKYNASVQNLIGKMKQMSTPQQRKYALDKADKLLLMIKDVIVDGNSRAVGNFHQGIMAIDAVIEKIGSMSDKEASDMVTGLKFEKVFNEYTSSQLDNIIDVLIEVYEEEDFDDDDYDDEGDFDAEEAENDMDIVTRGEVEDVYNTIIDSRSIDDDYTTVGSVISPYCCRKVSANPRQYYPKKIRDFWAAINKMSGPLSDEDLVASSLNMNDWLWYSAYLFDDGLEDTAIEIIMAFIITYSTEICKSPLMSEPINTNKVYEKTVSACLNDAVKLLLYYLDEIDADTDTLIEIRQRISRFFRTPVYLTQYLVNIRPILEFCDHRL